MFFWKKKRTGSKQSPQGSCVSLESPRIQHDPGIFQRFPECLGAGQFGLTTKKTQWFNLWCSDPRAGPLISSGPKCPFCFVGCHFHASAWYRTKSLWVMAPFQERNLINSLPDCQSEMHKSISEWEVVCNLGKDSNFDGCVAEGQLTFSLRLLESYSAKYTGVGKQNK